MQCLSLFSIFSQQFQYHLQLPFKFLDVQISWENVVGGKTTFAPTRQTCGGSRPHSQYLWFRQRCSSLFVHQAINSLFQWRAGFCSAGEFLRVNFQMVRTYEKAEILDLRVEKILAYILIEKVRETSET